MVWRTTECHVVFTQRLTVCVCVCVSVSRVNHSKNAIVKPQGPTPQEERREVEEAMKRIQEANQAIAKAMDTEPGECTACPGIYPQTLSTQVNEKSFDLKEGI